jgi:hypothetical protein
VEDKKHIRTVVALVLCGMLGACSIGYNKDAAYDPNFHTGERLFDQIPNNETNWDSPVCAGDTPASERKAHQTGRC